MKFSKFGILFGKCIYKTNHYTQRYCRGFSDKLIILFILNKKIPTHDLLSREVALQVSSAQLRLASGFGMGPGVSTAVWWVRKNFIFTHQNLY